MAVTTAYDLQGHLGIDVVDEQITTNLERAVNAACRWLPAAVGSNYEDNDPRVVELALITAADFYDNRGLSGTPGATVRKLARDLAMQLRVEGAEL
jgi:hypothetical protein